MKTIEELRSSIKQAESNLAGTVKTSISRQSNQNLLKEVTKKRLEAKKMAPGSKKKSLLKEAAKMQKEAAKIQQAQSTQIVDLADGVRLERQRKLNELNEELERAIKIEKDLKAAEAAQKAAEQGEQAARATKKMLDDF